MKMTTKFIAKGWIKFSEEDSWENGCLPETAISFSGDEYFEADNLEKLIDRRGEFIGQEDRCNYLLDSCDEAGRLDIQQYETAEGLPATEKEIDDWKAGKKKLWLAVYSFYIEKHAIEHVSLMASVGNPSQYARS